MKTFKQFANEVSDAVLKKKEEIFKSMKKKRSEFVARYGDDAENVMHATAMDRAKSSSIKN